MTNAQILKSLADETRLSIVRKLAKDRSAVACRDIVSDCSMALKLSQPTMSHHFSKLVQTGVIEETKVGTEKFYRLNLQLLDSVGINPHKL